MGAKKSAGKDRGYITATEWKLDGGGKKASSSATNDDFSLKKLPFNCCALSFLPFETPVFSIANGGIYDLENVLPYVMKHKRDPMTGKETTISELKS